jgi:tyrosine-protein phosphatase
VEEFSSSATSPEEDLDAEHSPTRISCVPPSAPANKTTFSITPPAYSARPSFGLPRPRTKRRPPPIGLPPVPSSPVTIVLDSSDSSFAAATSSSPHVSTSAPVQRVVAPPTPSVESGKAIPPPLYPRHSVLRKSQSIQDAVASTLPSSSAPQLNTPSQTLFVFPSSPTATRTPSTLTVTSTPSATDSRFPSLLTPRVSSFRRNGRSHSFIGVGTPATPTMAFTKLNVRGYVGIQR